MFFNDTIAIDRSVEEIYGFLANLRTHLKCWDILFVPKHNEIPEDVLSVEGSFRLGASEYPCVIELYRTREGSEVVSCINWENGQIAAEFRVISERGRTLVKLTIEGQGGALAAPIALQKMPYRILSRLKDHFTTA